MGVTSPDRNAPDPGAADGADDTRGWRRALGRVPLARDVAARLPHRHGGAQTRRAHLGWRVGTPVVVLVSGALFAVSGTNSEGTDLRPGRYTSLTDLTEAESRTYERLEAQARALEAEVETLSKQVDDDQVRRVERRAERLRGPAGLDPVSGPGLRIVMSDAPTETIEDKIAEGASEEVQNLLVVHQEDIQNLVNALWAGGARAVTIQGQRVVTTTGIKCSGSAVLLGGVPFPQPYTIEAVGDATDMVEAIDDNERITGFRADADNPDIGVGFDLTEEADVQAAGYDGLLDIDAATPRTTS